MKKLELFLESCRSESTKEQYTYLIKRWFDFAGFPAPTDPQDIQNKIIEYVLEMKKQGKSYGVIAASIVPVKTYYQINGVTLNIKLIDKLLPENRKVKTDRAYTHSEISKLLESGDMRARVLILLLASSGIRIGAVPLIKLRHLQDSKLTVYENSKEVYFTFITPECKQAIDSYLDMRSRYGEKLNDDSFLIIKQFDIRCLAKPRTVGVPLLQWIIYDLCKRCGIDKKNVSVAHGFRKFFTTQLINCKINPEIREMLLGHKIGLASAYYRPSDQDMYAEYMKAVKSLTINEEDRLKVKVQTLEKERTNYDFLNEKIDSIQSSLVEIINMATKNKTPEEVKELYKSYESMGKLKNENQ